MRHPRGRRVGWIAAVLAVVLAGCADVDGDGTARQADELDPPATFGVTEPPPEAGDFFTWQSRTAYSGPTAQVAQTFAAREYFTALSLRYGGWAEAGWADLYPRDADPAIPPRTGGLVRGPTSVRLMDVRVDGDEATTVACIDSRATQIRSGPRDTWRRSTVRVTALTDAYTRSADSPTGWVSEGPIDSHLTAAQCEDAFADRPATSRTGAVQLPDR